MRGGVRGFCTTIFRSIVAITSRMLNRPVVLALHVQICSGMINIYQVLNSLYVPLSHRMLSAHFIIWVLQCLQLADD
jgi:hypothetical protein